MGMPLEIHLSIVTDGKEQRLDQDNHFSFIRDNYHLYPLHSPVEVRKKRDGEISGIAEIKEIHWKNHQTEIIFELKKLKNVN